jgi:hypothetical protein
LSIDDEVEDLFQPGDEPPEGDAFSDLSKIRSRTYKEPESEDDYAIPPDVLEKGGAAEQVTNPAANSSIPEQPGVAAPAEEASTLPPARARATPGAPTKRRKEKGGRWSKFPWAWEEALSQAKHISTYRVALYILRCWWQNDGQPVPVSNVALPGVSRPAKSKAITELESLGLVKVKRDGQKAPIATPLKLPPRYPKPDR